MILDKIEFEMEVGGYVRGTITIGLFTDIVPKTVKNFIKLSTSDHFPSYKEMDSEFVGRTLPLTEFQLNHQLNPNLPSTYKFEMLVTVFLNRKIQ